MKFVAILRFKSSKNTTTLEFNSEAEFRQCCDNTTPRWATLIDKETGQTELQVSYPV